MSTATTYTLNDLVEMYREYSDELIACDPSKDENAMLAFFEIQTWGEELEAIAVASGFTWDQVEDAADSE